MDWTTGGGRRQWWQTQSSSDPRSRISAAGARMVRYQQQQDQMRYENEEMQHLIESGVLNPDGSVKPPKNPLQKVAGFIGDAVSGMAADAADSIDRWGGSIGRTLADATGQNRKIEENLQSIADGDWDMYQMATKKASDLTLDEEARKRWADVAEQYKEKSFKSQQAVSDYFKEKQDTYDPKKVAAAYAELGLDVATAGSVSSAVKGGRLASKVLDPDMIRASQKVADSRALSAVNKVINPAGLKQSMASGATLGVGYGAAGTVREMGDEATMGDVAEGALFGAAAGAGFGGSINVLGRVGRTVFSKFKDRSSDTAKAAESLLREAPEDILSQPGFVDRVNEMADSASNVREMKEMFNSYVNEVRNGNIMADGGEAMRAADSSAIIPESRQLGSGIERQRAEVDESIARLQAGEDNSVYRYTDSTGNDVSETARAYDDRVAEIDREIRRLENGRNQLRRQADGVDENTGRSEAPEGQDPSEFTGDSEGRLRAQEGVDDYNRQIEALQTEKQKTLDEQSLAFERMGGVSRTVDPQLARKRYQELRAQRAAVDAAEAIMEDTPSAIQGKLDDLEAGNVPDELIVDNPPAETGAEAVRRAMKADPQDQLGIQRMYQENEALREEAQEELSRLMTTERYERFVDDLNENYRLKKEEIDQLPGPMRDEEMELLDSDYMDQVADARANLDMDRARVEELNQAIEVGNQIDENIAFEWNSLEQSNPNVFGEVNVEAADLYRERLLQRKAELELKKPDIGRSPMDREDNLDIVVSEARGYDDVKAKVEGDDDVLLQAEELLLDQLSTTNADVSVLDTILRKPVTVLRKWGTAGETMADILTEGLEGKRMFNGELQARFKLNRWNVAMKPEYNDDFIGFLDRGQAITRGANESAQHFERRQAALNDIKLWLRETGEKLGLPEEVLNRNYLPHLIRKESGASPDQIAEAMAGLKAERMPDGKKITAKQRNEWEKLIEGVSPQTMQYIQQRKIYSVGENGFLKRRTGATDWETDPHKIISAYARAASNELYLKPAMKKAQMVAGKFRGKQRRYIDQVVEFYNNQGADVGSTVEQAASMARRAQNLALMGGSARTVMLQVDGATRIFTEADLGSFLESGLNSFQAVFGGLARGESPARSKMFQEATRAGALEDSFVQLLQGGRGITGFTNKLERVLYSGIAAVDTHMRVWAFDAGKRKYAKGLGKNVNQLTADELAEARKFGVDFANKTQFDMNALTIPVGQNTPAGRFLTQIQQFNINATKYNAKVLGNSLKSKEDFTKMAKMIVAYGALMATMTSLGNQVFGEEAGEWLNPMGFDPEDLLPFGEQVMGAIDIARGKEGAIGEFSVPTTPLLSFMFGSSYGDGLTDYASTVAKYRAGEIDEAEYNAAMHSLPSFLLRNILPAGTQINRSLEGYQTVTEGESVNRYGNTRFLVENRGGINLMRGLIGGQYATEEGQRWLREGMNTISSRHKIDIGGTKIPVSQYARSLSPDEQAQYIGYYSAKQLAERELDKAGLRRSDVTQRLRDSVKNGNMSIGQAELEAQRWNDKVRNLYAPYLNGNNNIPSRLVDDFTDSVLINIDQFGNMRL